MLCPPEWSVCRNDTIIYHTQNSPPYPFCSGLIHGPLPRTPGRRVVGPAVTLQFMPQREEIPSGMGAEHAEKSSALWRVFETIEPGDVLVVQAFGDLSTGCVGEMLS